LSKGFGIEKVDRRHDATFGLGNVLCSLRDYRSAEMAYRDFLGFVGSQLENNDSRVCGERYFLAWALHQQGKKADAEAVYLELGSIFHQALKDGRTIWWRVADRLAYADAVSMTKTDEASLQEAVQVLNEIEKDANTNRFTRNWWNVVFAETLDKLAQEEEAIRHSRIALENEEPDNLSGEQGTRSQLVRLLSDVGKYQEAEDVLRKAIVDYTERLGDDHVITDYARADLAELLVELKNYTEAEELLQRSQKALLSEPNVPTLQKQKLVGLLVKLYEGWEKPDQASLWRAKLDTVITSEPNVPDTKGTSGT
jgi:tetratricopeptide (TPR) repeat protein